MNTKLLKYISELLYVLLNFLTVYAFLMYFTLSNKTDFSSFLRPALLIFMPICSYVICKKIHRLTLFLFLHACVGFLLTILAGRSIIELAAFGIYCLLILFSSLYLQTTTSDDTKKSIAPVINLSILFICHLLYGYISIPSARTACTVLTVCFLLIYLLHHYLTQYISFIELNSHENTSLPAHRILGVGIAQLCCFSVFMAFILLIASPLNFSKLLNSIASFIGKLIAYLVSLIRYSAAPPLPDVLDLPPQYGKANPWMYFILFILFIAIIIFALYCFIRLLMSIYIRFYFRKDGIDDKRESLLTVRIEKTTSQRKNSVAFRIPHLGKNNNEKIRMLFYKTIYGAVKHMKIENRSGFLSLTPPQEFKILFDEPEMQEQMIMLAIYYEKARYSGLQCSRQDVLLAKECARQLR